VNAFVTGGTGFVGTHLVRRLLDRGDTVTCLVRDVAKARNLGWTAVRLVPGDLDNRDALRQGCVGADIVYHVAGRISARNLSEFLAANRDGTAHVLEAATQGGARRFVYVSSLAAAGPTVPGAPIDETRTPAPVTDYGRSKLAGEELVRGAKLPWTVVRPPVVYGERDRETFKIFQLAQYRLGLLIGDGTQELSVIYVGDLATALIAAGTTTSGAGRVYFAAHPQSTTSRGLVEAIGRALGTKPWILPIPGPLARGALWTIGSLAHLAGRATVLSADKANEFLAPAWTCRADALARDSGWRATVDLDSGVQRAASWYRTEGWL
jgi:nucleoside-diphosphate-sugar epimerase